MPTKFVFLIAGLLLAYSTLDTYLTTGSIGQAGSILFLVASAMMFGVFVGIGHQKALAIKNEPDGSGCPDKGFMGEHACNDPCQCWEPCGQLGHSKAHAKQSASF